MSAARFKSKNDYFKKNSSLTRKVIETPPTDDSKPDIDINDPVQRIKTLFFRTAEMYELDGGGRYSARSADLNDAIQKHLAGEADVLVNPVASGGETSWHVICFDISESLAHPFSKAKQMADALEEYGIPSLIEVAEGGKGHYYLWIFHDEAVDAVEYAGVFSALANTLFGVGLSVIPSGKDTYLPLPLQGEMALMQRSVFVNSVGKMIKDQHTVIASARPAGRDNLRNLADSMAGASGYKKQEPSLSAPLPKDKKTPDKKRQAVQTALPAEKNSAAASSTTKDAPSGKAPLPKTPAGLPVQKAPVRSTRPEDAGIESVLIADIAGERVAVDTAVVYGVYPANALEAGLNANDSASAYLSVGGSLLTIDMPRDSQDDSSFSVSLKARVIVFGRETPVSGIVAADIHDIASVTEVIAAGGGKPRSVVCSDGESLPLYEYDSELAGEEAKDAADFPALVSGSSRFLLARAGGTYFAFDAEEVSEILPYGSLAVAKNGVVSVRGAGKSLKTVDLIKGLSGEQHGISPCALLVHRGERSCAIIVGDVAGFFDIGRISLKPVAGSGSHESLIAARGHFEGRDVIVVDTGALF